MTSEEDRRAKNKYDNISTIYDGVRLFIPEIWRRKAVSHAYGRVLEVGIGTGLNLAHYLGGCQKIIGIDVSSQMLDKAKKKALQCEIPVTLRVMDVQNTDFTSASFDCVVATFVFCTVIDPSKGLKECYRVLKPGGKLILLEHMNSGKTALRWLINLVNPITVALLGDHLNRDTSALVARAGFKTEGEEYLFGDVVRIIVAKK